jgi:galactokinase
VNIIGEHTDYNDGLVLPMAIDLGATATVTATAQSGLHLSSAQFPGEQVSVAWEDLAPGVVDGWAAYPAGAVWAIRQVAEPDVVGLRVQLDSDVPLGAGLSSSAAIECSVGAAVAALWGLDLPRRELARLAQRAENEFVGVPTGSMDQVASAMGQEGHALLYDVRKDVVELVPVAMDAAGLTFIVIDTGSRHALVDGGYADRRSSCERGAALLGVPSLRDIEDLDKALSAVAEPTLKARVRHVVTENTRVAAAVQAMRGGDFGRLGLLMNESHASLRDDFDVSCDELDAAVEAALSAGALGARMTGGGFGGSAIALVRQAEVGVVAVAVREVFAARSWSAPRIRSVHPAAGARVLSHEARPEPE